MNGGLLCLLFLFSLMLPFASPSSHSSSFLPSLLNFFLWRITQACYTLSTQVRSDELRTVSAVGLFARYNCHLKRNSWAWLAAHEDKGRGFMTSSSARMYDKPLGLLNVVMIQTDKFCSWLIIHVLKLVGFVFMAIDMDRFSMILNL